MDVDCIKVGNLRCNCYLISNETECLLIDPGDDLDKIEKFIDGKNVIGILITHGHFDHIGCVKDLVSKYNFSVYDNSNLVEGINKIGSFSFEVIKCYGHTMDSISFYFKKEKIMFTGDFLFKQTIGRCDLDESNSYCMMRSIENIKKYDDDIVIYPGHGMSSVLGIEKKTNPYFN